MIGGLGEQCAVVFAIHRDKIGTNFGFRPADAGWKRAWSPSSGDIAGQIATGETSRGDNVMAGYWHAPNSGSVTTDSWLQAIWDINDGDGFINHRKPHQRRIIIRAAKTSPARLAKNCSHTPLCWRRAAVGIPVPPSSLKPAPADASPGTARPMFHWAVFLILREHQPVRQVCDLELLDRGVAATVIPKSTVSSPLVLQTEPCTRRQSAGSNFGHRAHLVAERQRCFKQNVICPGNALWRSLPRLWPIFAKSVANIKILPCGNRPNRARGWSIAFCWRAPGQQKPSLAATRPANNHERFQPAVRQAGGCRATSLVKSVRNMAHRRCSRRHGFLNASLDTVCKRAINRPHACRRANQPGAMNACNGCAAQRHATHSGTNTGVPLDVKLTS